ncbi:replication initiation protein [Campylobacter upsaliensis]|uniref:replication initiation protein n=1 Tax=Campylobacter upsaliensis TaxID=28080 RepID=UPI002B394488|nr:replication initiation protein [Campylobacter upsaliensis]MEB2819700.1 replication initiation protein [Campylobacter upsaliensis]
MNEIVKYHNDFNKIKLPAFTEIEQDLLITILSKVKNKGFGNMIELFPNDLKINEKLNSRQYLTDVMDSLKLKFFKANFREIIETETEIIDKTINLFQEMQIHYVKRNPNDGYDTSKLFNRIVLIVNPKFAYLVNNITQNFTAFELNEFIALSGKYTKTLYRILKQFRSTGKAYFEWSEFLRIMDIPENKTTGDIDKFILKPALKELTKERNIFDQIRVPFKNLAYEKEKQKGTRGRGGKVIGITFTFKPENIDMQKLAKESEKIETKEDKYLRIAHNMVKNKARFVYKNMLYEANSFDYKELKFMAVRLIRDEFENLIYDIGQTFNAKNKEAFFKMIDTFKNNIV